MQWFKLYGAEMLADPKYQRLTAAERSCWITLLCLASLNEGVVKHCDEQYLMSHSGIDPSSKLWSETHGILIKLEMLGMISLGKDEVGVTFVTVRNWQKRQEVRSESYERVKRWREKQRQLEPSRQPVTDVTLLGNVREEEIRIDKKRISSKEDGNVTEKRELSTKESLLRIAALKRKFPAKRS